MLQIKNLHSSSDDCIFYQGKNNYYIYHSKNGFCLVVDGGEEKKYACNSLSSAIACVEALENGEEI